MATPNFSALLPDVTTHQLTELTKIYGIGKTQVVIRAISDLYRKEFPVMNIPLNYQPHSEYQGYAIEVATGIGGYYARTEIKISDDEIVDLETGPNDTEKGVLQSMRNTIKDALFAYGFTNEPS